MSSTVSTLARPRSLILLAALCAIPLLFPSVSVAEPYIAIREGYKCSKCHTNMTGGGKRTDFGNIYSQTTLPLMHVAPWKKAGSTDGEEASGLGQPLQEFFSGRIAEYISLGADLRAANTTIVPPSGPKTNDFEVTEGTLYLQADLIENHLIFYLDERVAPGGAQSREAVALLKGLPYNAYVKAGKFFLPYGLRLQDDSAFIRQVTGFNYQNPDIGVEIGAEPGPFSISFAVSNGTQGAGENNIDKQYSLIGSYTHRWFRVGASFSFNQAPGGDERLAHNVFGGFTVGRFTFLGEIDRVRDRTGAGAETDQYMTLIEGNILIAKGVNLKITYEFLDPNIEITEDERDRWSIVLEPFVTQFGQVRIGVRINDAPPQQVSNNSEEIFVEAHVFF